MSSPSFARSCRKRRLWAPLRRRFTQPSPWRAGCTEFPTGLRRSTAFTRWATTARPTAMWRPQLQRAAISPAIWGKRLKSAPSLMENPLTTASALVQRGHQCHRAGDIDPYIIRFWWGGHGADEVVTALEKEGGLWHLRSVRDMRQPARGADAGTSAKLARRIHKRHRALHRRILCGIGRARRRAFTGAWGSRCPAARGDLRQIAHFGLN